MMHTDTQTRTQKKDFFFKNCRVLKNTGVGVQVLDWKHNHVIVGIEAKDEFTIQTIPGARKLQKKVVANFGIS